MANPEITVRVVNLHENASDDNDNLKWERWAGIEGLVSPEIPETRARQYLSLGYFRLLTEDELELSLNAKAAEAQAAAEAALQAAVNARTVADKIAAEAKARAEEAAALAKLREDRAKAAATVAEKPAEKPEGGGAKAAGKAK
jgi:hypothetical protein